MFASCVYSLELSFIVLIEMGYNAPSHGLNDDLRTLATNYGSIGARSDIVASAVDLFAVKMFK